MAVNEGLKPTDGSAVPIDPNVRIPDHVRRAAEEAEAIYKQAYPAEAPPAPQDQVQPDPQDQVQPAPQEAQTTQDQVQSLPQASDFTGPADAKSLGDSEWARRYNSMQGRWQAAQRTIGAMEQQMTELGQELVRTQNLVASLQAGNAVVQPQSGQHHGNLITEEDRANYGDELIDLARRAARETVTPELEQLRADNAKLTARVKSTGKREMFQQLDRDVPNWRQINVSAQFKNWLHLPNVYTGQPRGVTLKAAVDGVETPKVVALFRDFLAEANATGQIVPQAQIEQQPAPLVPPHQAALSLESLAAPGRARPAAGDSQVPADKPFYSRAQISQLYRDKQRGLYAGREADFAAAERDLEAAQREGRIRG
jgi:hypothetical protein